MLAAVHNRRPWFAALLSFFLTPAMGMAYLNRGWFSLLYLLLLLAAVGIGAMLYPRLGPDSALQFYLFGMTGAVIIAGTVHAIWIARWYDPSRRLRWYARYWQWFALLSVLWLAAGWVIPAFAYQSFHAASYSMVPSLERGDHVLVSKFRARDFHPERGDVVVFYDPAAKVHFIKRVVGLPGDSVQMQGGVLFINGVQVPLRRLPDLIRPCNGRTCRIARYEETLPGGHRGVILKRLPFDDADSSDLLIVPEDTYFMLGDDRDNSQDSRHPGPVPRRDLIGRVVVRYIADGRWTWQTVD